MASLEVLLGNLLVPDNGVIQQATQQLKDACKDPGIVVQLCQVVSSAQNPQVRQYGAVLLRRRMTKKKQWSGLPDDFKQHLRSTILHVVVQEQEKSVRNAVVQIVASVAKHELGNGWVELFAFLEEFTKSPDPQKREIGLYVLSQVAYSASEQLKPHLVNLCQLFDQSLQDSHKNCQYYAILTMTHLICQIGTDEQGKFQALVPKIVLAIQGLVVEDEDKACAAMEVLDELVESDVAVIVPHVKPIVEFCLEIGAKQDLGDEIRVKALSFIGWLTRLKKKSILKHKLVEPILDVLFTIMCHPHEDDDDEENEDGAETSDPHSYAGQVIDTMSLHLPPQKIIPKMLTLIKPALESPNPHHKKAAYLALAVMVEGCSETIRNNHLDALLQCLAPGIQNPDPVVRNAALFALGQFSEHLQPDISKFAGDLIPLLLAYLKEGHFANTSESALSKTYYALEMFCENLGKDIIPFLPALMEQLLSGLNDGKSIRVRELSISAIAATANAAKEDIVPYFQSIFEPLKPYLSVQVDKEMLPLQSEAFDTLAVVARVIGAKHFLPLTHDCLQLGTQVITTTEDPDLKRCVYGLMAAISTLIKQEMGQFLQPIVNQMIESIKSVEGVTVHFADEEEDGFKVFDEEDLGTDDTESDEDDSEIHGYSVENAYLEEKEDACLSLGEIAINCEQAFMPFIEPVYDEIKKMLDHPASIVRKASGQACAQLCVCLAKSAEQGVQDAGNALLQMVAAVLPRLLSCVREDLDRDVVTGTLEAVKLLLDEVKGPVLANPEHFPAISDCVKCVLDQKTACQDADEDPELDSEESEYDSVLMECAGDIIPALIKVQNDESSMALVVAVLPDLVKKLKKDASESERSFAIGTIAEIIEALGDKAEVFVEQLYPVVIATIQDEDKEVRSNAVYACGVLAKNGGPKILTKYDEILKLLSSILSREHNKRCVDNICGAVCRMLLRSPQSMPVDQIVPVVLKNLPLKEDFDENSTVFECLNSLYDAGQKDVIENLGPIVTTVAVILSEDQAENGCKALVTNFVKRVAQNQPDVLNATMASLDERQKLKLQECLSM